jgi:hypothetical protein
VPDWLQGTPVKPSWGPGMTGLPSLSRLLPNLSVNRMKLSQLLSDYGLLALGHPHNIVGYLCETLYIIINYTSRIP